MTDKLREAARALLATTDWVNSSVAYVDADLAIDLRDALQAEPEPVCYITKPALESLTSGKVSSVRVWRNPDEPNGDALAELSQTYNTNVKDLDLPWRVAIGWIRSNSGSKVIEISREGVQQSEAEAIVTAMNSFYAEPGPIDALIAEAIEKHDEAMAYAKTVNTRKLAQPVIDALIAEIDNLFTLQIGDTVEIPIDEWDNFIESLDKYRSKPC